MDEESNARMRTKMGWASEARASHRRPRAAALEGTQEGDELILLCGAQVVEVVGYGLSFAVVTLNGVEEGARAAVMQQLRARAHSPKWRRAHFLSGFLSAGLHDAVTCADIVQ